ncbi:hypothetical protein P175DRAFT_0153031 [Aspergillus ochraceoroseus IBT 24754]|uniref:BZIP domain-containing protein n=3 Tax=Aspergillus subgen. Nidulantes TaxID=2720870 RepID=A0A0F8UYG5_9EURO|nr:uncharacterized protein P175DRAFT_0153031 [Aspergillus ochraceoroseus IBT 24754]KKK15826.1 hypothetical protein ARAM_006745 [Aspergillus rambellii]KKK24699.1 hypothetical protein AOCH_005639 [Aspergillus ochraceoroseus]PTU22978.1 hypothetical protein P175DRAFT_0153031 [Aspergillus ochraceoroseus IBT 24754]
MSSNSDSGPSKKRESRAGTRRVTSLTAEQLERKRANDREAQRTIRQRTKEHIERLELQVAELKAKGDRFDEVARRNAVLENEIRALRHQLAMAAGGSSYQNMEESYGQQTQQQQQHHHHHHHHHPGSLVPSPQYPEALGANATSRTPSVLSTSSQVSVTREWQPYGSTRTSSRGESTDTEYPPRVEPWAFEGPSQTPVPISIPPSHVGFNQPTSGQMPDPAFQPYPQIYPPPNANRGSGEGISSSHTQGMPYEPIQRAVSAPSERQSTGYPAYHSAPQYPHPMNHQQRSDYEYDWTHRS